GRARPHPQAASAGLRDGGRGCRGRPRPDRAAPPHLAPHPGDHRQRDDPRRQQHPGRGGPELPRAGRGRADAELGEHGLGRRELRPAGALAGRRARHRDLRRRARLQPAGRGAARSAEPARATAMTTYWLRRLAEAVPLLIGVSLIVFAIFRLSPGDPVALLVDPTLLSERERQAIRDELGVNDPFFVQYGKMMWGLATGELRSFKSKQPTYQIIGDAFPTTLIVTTLGLALSVLTAFPLGAAAARCPGGRVDRALSVAMATTLAFPTFLFGLLLLRLFTEEWRLLPGSGIGPRGMTGFDPVQSLPYLVMPAIVTAALPATILARYLRDSLQEVLTEDYI